MASIEVLGGPERRRRWSIEQKHLIVTAAFEPGAVVREVARRCDVTASLIYCWRRDLRAVANQRHLYPGKSVRQPRPAAGQPGLPRLAAITAAARARAAARGQLEDPASGRALLQAGV